jgi:hypothetical protein
MNFLLSLLLVPFRAFVCFLAAIEAALAAAVLCWQDPDTWRERLFKPDSDSHRGPS